MGQYRLSPRAQADLENIWDYTEERWGQSQAESYVRSIQAAIAAVTEDPRRGQKCDDIRKGYLGYSVERQVLFFRQIPEGIDVVRILHQSMNFDRHL